MSDIATGALLTLSYVLVVVVLVTIFIWISSLIRYVTTAIATWWYRRHP